MHHSASLLFFLEMANLLLVGQIVTMHLQKLLRIFAYLLKDLRRREKYLGRCWVFVLGLEQALVPQSLLVLPSYLCFDGDSRRKRKHRRSRVLNGILIATFRAEYNE